MDTFRLYMIRSSPKVKRFGPAVEILLWILLGVGTFFLLYFIKSGIWRYVDPIAQWVGIITYDLFLKEIGRKIGRIIYYLFIWPCLKIVSLVISIIKFFLKVIIAIVMFFINPIIKLVGKFWKKLPKKLSKKRKNKYNNEN